MAVPPADDRGPSRAPLGRAPRASTTESSGAAAARAGAERLVAELIANFREQVRRAVGVELDDTETSLAFVDHYLRLARDEDREPIVKLVAAGAGAYYGELVARHLGASWIGDGKDPRRLRLLMTPIFLYFSPVDQAIEAIAGHEVEPDDPRHPSDGPILDPGFHLRPSAQSRSDSSDEHRSGEPSDADWLEERLSELPPVPEDEYHSLTCRFETLKLMLELLAAKHASQGREPSELDIDDYLSVFATGEA